MKKVIFAIAVMFVLASCANNTSESTNIDSLSADSITVDTISADTTGTDSL